MEFRRIRQTARIGGENRNPGVSEHGKAMVWNNISKEFEYVLYNSLLPNSKTNSGYVMHGDSSAGPNYVWKLDAQKNPAWRQEQYLQSAVSQTAGNSLVLTMSEGGVYTIPLGALAWVDEVESAVDSVFGRTGEVTSQNGDYTASQVTNAFDKSANTLNDIQEGSVNKHFTVDYQNAINANTIARHIHLNKGVLDLITNAGGGIIPTFTQIDNWDTLYANAPELIRDTVASFVQNGTGISFTHNDEADALTPAINMNAFTTDDLPEGDTNKYYREAVNNNNFTIILPSGSTVAQRCAAPLFLPSGWAVAPTGSGVDLLITHNLTKAVAMVTVFSISGSTGDERLLLSNAAFSGVLSDSTKNNLIVEALATVPTAIRINVTLV
jgi:hypothetical protein